MSSRPFSPRLDTNFSEDAEITIAQLPPYLFIIGAGFMEEERPKGLIHRIVIMLPTGRPPCEHDLRALPCRGEPGWLPVALSDNFMGQNFLFVGEYHDTGDRTDSFERVEASSVNRGGGV